MSKSRMRRDTTNTSTPARGEGRGGEGRGGEGRGGEGRRGEGRGGEEGEGRGGEGRGGSGQSGEKLIKSRNFWGLFRRILEVQAMGTYMYMYTCPSIWLHTLFPSLSLSSYHPFPLSSPPTLPRLSFSYTI